MGFFHNSYRRRFQPSASIPADNAHIVVIFDESRTMRTELAWLTTALSEMESSLRLSGFGFSSPNRYSLIGFAGTSAPQGKVIQLEGGVCDSADEIARGLSQLEMDGRTEDGYSAINVALGMLDRCNSGTNSQTIFLLFTDEDRDTLRGFGDSLTYDSTLASLRAANVRLNTIVKQDYIDSLGRLSFGIDSQRNAYVISSAGLSFESSDGGRPIQDSAFGTTESDYANLALATSGATFSTNTLRQPNNRDGFQAALVNAIEQQVAAERTRPLCQDCRCNNGTQQCNNLILITDRSTCEVPGSKQCVPCSQSEIGRQSVAVFYNFSIAEPY